MAELSRTVRVTGLPSELQQGALLDDKLCIHFQRGRNGGGEVVSVTTVKTPDFALVTFEESGVAQRVAATPQTLEVDGRSFNLTVKEHPGGSAQDQVIVNLSATVDLSRVSGGKRTLKSVQKSHPEVHMSLTSAPGLCSFIGSYSAVQAALAQLLGQNQLPQSATEKEPKHSPENRPSPPTPSPRTQVIRDQSRSQKDKKERPLVEKHTSLQRDVTPGGHEWELQGATASPTDSEEDFSLIVDADTFQYLQKCCREEYHQILRKHGVAVVDYTHQGLTTLLFQVASGDGVNERERLKNAKTEISQLYEENQANICRDKLFKSMLPNSVGLKTAIDELSGKFSKLFFSEDEQNVFLIGGREEVAEAKTFLLLYDYNKEDKTELTSPRRFQDSWPRNETKAPVASPGVLESNGIDKDEEHVKLDGSSKVKLAAQFKDPHIAPIGSKTSDFTVRGHSQLGNKKRQGPMLAYDVLSEANRTAYVNAQNTGGDILFKSMNATMQNANLADTRPKTTNANANASPIQADSLDAQSQTKTGSSLRRASSLSRVTQKKDQENSPKTDLETGKARGRSSSFTGTELNAEIRVHSTMWFHIKEAYKPRIEELTSGIQLREISSAGDSVNVLLTGTSGAKVKACQDGLQKLVDSVSVDFIIVSLSLRELGIADPKDETLQVCCDEIRSRYKKISIVTTSDGLFLLGPQIMCSQVQNVLREIFAGAQVGLQDYSRPSTSAGSESFKNPPNENVGKVSGRDSPRKDPVTKEKVRRPAGLEGESQNVQESIRNANGSVTTRNDRTAREQTTAITGALTCLRCDKTGTTVKSTKCGWTLCSDCVRICHLQCKICEERTEEPREEPKKELRPQGVQGRMSYAPLPMSIPGFLKDPVVKITYCIPDGIQGGGDPSPGEPFKGGTFEAYLPDCEQTRRLLPRLKEAFRRGHTFTVIRGRVNWDAIPHKTSLHGGKPTGYPDSTYLSRLESILNAFGIP